MGQDRRLPWRSEVCSPLVVVEEQTPPGMSDPARKPNLPVLENLHERHPGLTKNLCGALAEAARVCLARHHQSPTDVELVCLEGNCVRALVWQPPHDAVARAWANETDATEGGAYSISLASVEAELGLVAQARAETRTGADYYVGPIGQAVDLESAHRLEVSGTDDGDRREVLVRVRKKLRQAAQGRSDRPALVAVVGFLSRLVVIAPLREGEE